MTLLEIMQRRRDWPAVMNISKQSRIAGLLLFGWVYLVFLLQTAGAETLPKAFFETGPAEMKTLVEEISYQYFVRKYSPPVKVKLVKNREDVSYASPEEAVIAHISAMVAGDYEWSASGWDKVSQKFNSAHLKSVNLTPDLVTKKWKETFKDRRFELITRVDFRGGVLIEYRAISQSKAENNALTLKNVVKKQPDGMWKLTQEFRSHPVKIFWRTPEEKVRRFIWYSDGQ